MDQGVEEGHQIHVAEREVQAGPAPGRPRRGAQEPQGRLERPDPLLMGGKAARLRLTSLIPQAFSADHFGTRVTNTPAASNKYIRSMASPHFEIRPDQSTSPEACRRVVNPT